MNTVASRTPPVNDPALDEVHATLLAEVRRKIIGGDIPSALAHFSAAHSLGPLSSENITEAERLGRELRRRLALTYAQTAPLIDQPTLRPWWLERPTPKELWIVGMDPLRPDFPVLVAACESDADAALILRAVNRVTV
jgi:hypothetical protein